MFCHRTVKINWVTTWETFKTTGCIIRSQWWEAVLLVVVVAFCVCVYTVFSANLSQQKPCNIFICTRKRSIQIYWINESLILLEEVFYLKKLWNGTVAAMGREKEKDVVCCRMRALGFHRAGPQSYALPAFMWTNYLIFLRFGFSIYKMYKSNNPRPSWLFSRLGEKV